MMSVGLVYSEILRCTLIRSRSRFVYGPFFFDGSIGICVLAKNLGRYLSLVPSRFRAEVPFLACSVPDEDGSLTYISLNIATVIIT
jgi:hypothetical protein